MASETSQPYPVELVLYLTDLHYLNGERLKRVKDRFECITVAGPSRRPEIVPKSIQWHFYEENSTRAEVWNQLLGESRKKWVLFLEDDEELHVQDLPDPSDLSVKTWYPAQVLQSDGRGGRDSYYQMRLVTAVAASLLEGQDRTSSPLFDGKNLPDCTRTLTKHGIELSRPFLRIDRTRDPYAGIESEEEFSAPFISSQLHLLEGKRLFSAKKYVHATAHYRSLLKREKLLPFDRLAAVNGMAQCYTEQYKWDKAVNLAQQSIEAEPRQRIPWLILYRIYQLRQQWEEAFSALESYHEVLPEVSLASFDKTIDERESLDWFVKIAIRAGKKPQALHALEQLVTLKEKDFARKRVGETTVAMKAAVGMSHGVATQDADSVDKSLSVDRSLYRQILDLSVELKEKQKADHYFSRLFEDLPKVDLHNVMSGFMENGWYDLVSEVYTRLYEKDPRNREYRRRLIASLIKQGKLQKARELAAAKITV